MPATDLTPVKSGVETLVNTTTLYRQEASTVTAMTDGTYVVTWIKQTGLHVVAWDVQAQRFAADGSAIGSEFTIHSYSADNQASATVTALPGGGFFVSWTSFQLSGFPGANGLNNEVFGRGFAADNSPLSAEFRLSDGTDAQSQGGGVARLTDGNLVSAWWQLAAGAPDSIQFQKFSPTGTLIGARVEIAVPNGPGSYANLEVTGLANGGFLLTWSADDANQKGVYAQFFDAAGTASGSAFLVNTSTAGPQGQEAAVQLANGNVVITWAGHSADYGEIYAQIFTPAGLRIGTEFLVNTGFTSGGQVAPAIAALDDGGFLITWTSNTDDYGGTSVNGQRFGANGAALGGNFQINTVTPGSQFESGVTQLNNGTVVTTWTTDQGVDSHDVKAQLFTLPPAPKVLTGTNAGEALLGGAADDSLSGLGGNDTLTGGAGHDTLRGGAGNDSLLGQAGNDTLDGGTGNDIMAGGTGDDRYIVDSLGDVLVEQAGEGRDNVFASISWTLGAEFEDLHLSGSGALNGTGNGLANFLHGNAGANRMEGGGGNDSLHGDAGNDTLLGGDGNDLVDGEVGDDSLEGGAGNDNLTGDAGADTLRGDAGNDTLEGGAGRDVLTGGAGRDIFLFASLADSATGAPDVITDFVRGADRIHVKNIDPLAAAGDQAFVFIGGAEFAGGGVAQARVYAQSGNSFAAFDVGDGGAAEMIIQITGLVTLTASDFIL